MRMMKSTLELPTRPLRNLQARSVELPLTRTLLDHLLPSLPAHLLRMRLLRCTLLAVLHPLPNAAPSLQPLNLLLRGPSSSSLTGKWLVWMMMTFNLQEVRANQAREGDPMGGPPPRAPRVRKTRLARRRRESGARKPKPPLPLPTLRWHQCKVINYTKQSRKLVH